MLNFSKHVNKKAVNQLIENSSDIDLFPVIEKSKYYHYNGNNK